MIFRSKWIRWTVALVAFIGGAYFLFATLKKKSELALLNPRKGYEVVSASTLLDKPIIDLTLPGGHRLTLPARSTTTFPLNRLTMSGVTRFKNPRPGSGGTGVASFDWTIEGERYHFEGLFDMDAPYYDGPCPLFFGSEPVIAEDIGFDAEPIRVRCPANGIPEPKIPATSILAGAHRLKLRPQRWRSPMFQLLYYVSVEGSPDVNRVTLDFNNGEHKKIELFTEPGKETLLYLEKWLPITKMTASVTTLRKSKTDFKVTYVVPSVTSPMGSGMMTTAAPGASPKDGFWCHFTGAGETFKVGRPYGELGFGPKIAGVQLGPKTYFQEAKDRSLGPFLWDSDQKLSLGITKVGDVYPGYIYREDETHKASFTLNLPDRKNYGVP